MKKSKQHCANPQPKTLSPAKARRLAFELQIAAQEGREHLMRVLLEQGADPNLPNHQANTALHYAASGGHASSLRILLPRSDPNQCDLQGWPALFYAIARDNACAAEMLLPITDLSLRDDDGCGALHLAAIQAGGRSHETLRILAALMPAGARDRQGRTPLHAAACAGILQNIEILAQTEDPSAADSNGMTPAQAAEAAGQDKAAAMLFALAERKALACAPDGAPRQPGARAI